MKDALGLTLGALLDIPFDSRSPMQREAIAAAREALAQPQEPRNFCPRCGKRTADLTVIHTCTPPRGLEMT